MEEPPLLFAFQQLALFDSAEKRMPSAIFRFIEKV